MRRRLDKIAPPRRCDKERDHPAGADGPTQKSLFNRGNMSTSGTLFENHPAVGLDSIISTPVLAVRQTRAPNHVAENDALMALAEKLATSPNDVLQKLADGADRLPELAEIALFRILQESLTNVHRHSGSSTVEVHLRVLEGQAVFTVRDFGRGMTAELIENAQTNGNCVGVGLSGMRERVNDLGGTLELKSSRDGTSITVSIPLAAETSEQSARFDLPKSSAA
jgi:signal transduction histidine kinase